MNPRDPIPAPVVTYAYTDPPPPGVAREVAPGVHWVRMPLPFAPEHINLWLLEDGPGWTIIDCGYGTAQTKVYGHPPVEGALRRECIVHEGAPTEMSNIFG